MIQVTISINGELYKTNNMPEYVPLQRLNPALAASFGLGEKFISLRYNGRILLPEETLAAAGIRDGARLDLVAFTPLSSADLNNLLGLLDRLLRGFQEIWNRYKKSCVRHFDDIEMEQMILSLIREFRESRQFLEEFSGGVVDRIPIEEQREFVRWIIGCLVKALEPYEDFLGRENMPDPLKVVDFYSEAGQRLSLTKAGITHFLERKCPFDWETFKASDDIVLCMNCQLAMHRACWKAERRCPVCSCSEVFDVPKPL